MYKVLTTVPGTEQILLKCYLSSLVCLPPSVSASTLDLELLDSSGEIMFQSFADPAQCLACTIT